MQQGWSCQSISAGHARREWIVDEISVESGAGPGLSVPDVGCVHSPFLACFDIVCSSFPYDGMLPPTFHGISSFLSINLSKDRGNNSSERPTSASAEVKHFPVFRKTKIQTYKIQEVILCRTIVITQSSISKMRSAFLTAARPTWFTDTKIATR